MHFYPIPIHELMTYHAILRLYSLCYGTCCHGDHVHRSIITACNINIMCHLLTCSSSVRCFIFFFLQPEMKIVCLINTLLRNKQLSKFIQLTNGVAVPKIHVYLNIQASKKFKTIYIGNGFLSKATYLKGTNSILNSSIQELSVKLTGLRIRRLEG